jgi:DNA-binding transcriptional regulator YdaS (Cro superfamily)
MKALRDWREQLPPGARTLDAAGELLGVTGVQMYRYERDLRRIPPEKVRAIAVITGIPEDVLRPDVFGPPRPLKRISKSEATPAG